MITIYVEMSKIWDVYEMYMYVVSMDVLDKCIYILI